MNRAPSPPTLILAALLGASACAGSPDPLPIAPPTEVPAALQTSPPDLIGPPSVLPPVEPPDTKSTQADGQQAQAGNSRFNVDRNAPIHVRADSISLDQKRGVTVYRGKVSFEQGGFRINADRVEATLKGERLESIHASGRPLRFRHAAVGETQEVRGSAARLEYQAASGQLNLFGDVRVEQGRNVFRSAVMRYDLSAETLAADGSDSGQVSVVIEPAALGAEDAAGRLKRRGQEQP